MKRNNYDLIFRGDRDPFFDDWFDLDLPFARGNKREIMKTDIKELDNAYVLEVDLPGFDKKDVNLNLENGYLTISAKREHHFDGILEIKLPKENKEKKNTKRIEIK